MCMAVFSYLYCCIVYGYIFNDSFVFFRIADDPRQPRTSIRSEGLDNLLRRVVGHSETIDPHKGDEISTSLFVNQCINTTELIWIILPINYISINKNLNLKSEYRD